LAGIVLASLIPVPFGPRNRVQPLGPGSSPCTEHANKIPKKKKRLNLLILSIIALLIENTHNLLFFVGHETQNFAESPDEYFKAWYG
jgi:hypothetical protein